MAAANVGCGHLLLSTTHIFVHAKVHFKKQKPGNVLSKKNHSDSAYFKVQEVGMSLPRMKSQN